MKPRKMTKQEMFLCASRQYGTLIAAGWTPDDLIIAAGWTLGALIAAGWTPDDLRELTDEISVLKNPYSQLLSDIEKKKRCFKQSTFGPQEMPKEENICGTPMCTAGHLVSMAGEKGWELKTKYGFEIAAILLHDATHPGWPVQDYGGIPDEWALAYIETMAEREQKEAAGQGA